MSDAPVPAPDKGTSDDDIQTSTSRWTPKNVAKIGLYIFVVLPALVLAIRHLQHEEKALQQLAQTSWTTLGSITLCIIGCQLLNGMVMRDLVAHFGPRLRFVEWTGLNFIATALNVLTPLRGGAAIRAVYLKKRHDLDYASFATTFGVGLLFFVAANGSLGAIGLLALGVPGGASGQLALTFCLAIVAATAVAVVWTPTPAASDHKVLRPLLRIIRGWRTVADDQTLVTKLAAYTSLNALLHAYAFVLAFASTGFTGTPWVPVVSSASAKIGIAMSITPAGLGLTEAFGVVSAQIVGAGLSSSLLAILVVRAISILVSFAFALLFLPPLWSYLRASPEHS